MEFNLTILLACIISYFLGSIPNALWVSKTFKNIDIRQRGSKNMGSTNVSRVVGYKYGLLVLILDISKAIIPTLVAKIFYGNDIAIIVGFFAILGHCYSIFVGFKGGKAVACTIGVLLIVSPISIIIGLVAFFIVCFLTEFIISIASISMGVTNFVAVLILYDSNILKLFSLLIAILMIYKHKSNIINFINKKESKFFDKEN